MFHLLDLDIQVGGICMFQNVNVANNSPIEIIANHEYRLFLTRYSIITYIESEKLATNGLTPVPLKDIPSLKNNATHSLGQIFILRRFRMCV